MSSSSEVVVKGANLKKNDGVMVFILRESGEAEVIFPQLGRISEGRLEHYQMHMYRSLLAARAAESRGER